MTFHKWRFQSSTVLRSGGPPSVLFHCCTLFSAALGQSTASSPALRNDIVLFFFTEPSLQTALLKPLVFGVATSACSSTRPGMNPHPPSTTAAKAIAAFALHTRHSDLQCLTVRNFSLLCRGLASRPRPRPLALHLGAEVIQRRPVRVWHGSLLWISSKPPSRRPLRPHNRHPGSRSCCLCCTRRLSAPQPKDKAQIL